MDEKIILYETLLNEKSSLEKECFEINLKYIKEFGDEIEELFQLKVEAITLKKKLAFLTRKKNLNEKIYSFELEQYIDEEILLYQEELNDLIALNKASKEEGERITFLEVKKIKKLYYEIVHMIHPDLHKEYAEDPKISELWNSAVDAYKCNQYQKLIEIYDQIIILIGDENEIVIENIEGKIELIKDEIADIKNNNPYQYKFLLDDKDEINEYHESLRKDINDYKEYKSNLEKELDKFDIITSEA